MSFVGNKAGLSNGNIIDKRFKYNTLKKLGKETLAKFVCFIDYTTTVVEIRVSFKLEL